MSATATDPAVVLDHVAELASTDVSCLDRAGVSAALAKLATVRAWTDVMHGRLTRRLRELAEQSPSILPEADVATASKTSRRAADRASKRADTLGEVPEMETALADGAVSTDHVDALGRALERLQPEERELLAADGQRLTDIARRSTPEQFDASMRREIRRLDSDEGADRLQKQRRANRLRSWTDPDTGMVCIRAEFDPESGLRLLGALQNAVETLFHSAVPDTCPTGEGKQDHLRALALIALVEGRRVRRAAGADGDDDDAGDGGDSGDSADSADSGDGGGAGTTEITRMDDRCEILLVIDLETIINGLHEHSIVDNGHGVDLPLESYRRMACRAAIIPVVLDSNGVCVDAGREIRLANRGQRRALRAMYATCGIPGCRVKSRHCEPHHIRWWRKQGRTDLNNLLPLCSRHHHCVHEGGWQLVMHIDRSLTITYPDGAVQTTGPPATQRAG